MRGLGERVSLAGLTIASLLTGAILLAIGWVLRQPRRVAAGQRQIHSHARERRWIPNDAERERHAEVVAERLGIAAAARPEEIRVAEAAARLGVSASTVRRRVQRGELVGVFQNGRMTGVVLEAD
jgi:excisionase family DNA binding protein